MVAASVAYAVESLVVGKSVVGFCREYSWFAPPLEPTGDIGGATCNRPFFTEKGYSVGVGGEGGILTHVCQHVHYFVAPRLDNHFR